MSISKSQITLAAVVTLSAWPDSRSLHRRSTIDQRMTPLISRCCPTVPPIRSGSTTQPNRHLLSGQRQSLENCTGRQLGRKFPYGDDLYSGNGPLTLSSAAA